MFHSVVFIDCFKYFLPVLFTCTYIVDEYCQLYGINPFQCDLNTKLQLVDRKIDKKWIRLYCHHSLFLVQTFDYRQIYYPVPCDDTSSEYRFRFSFL